MEAFIARLRYTAVLERWLLTVTLGCASAVILLAGCGGSSRLSNQGSSSRFFSPGIPHFDVLASPTWEGDAQGVAIRISLTNASLVFLVDEELYQATYEVIGRLYDEDGEVLRQEVAWPETTTVSDYETTQRREPAIRNYFLRAPEGNFVLEVVIRDNNTGKSASWHQSIQIPSFQADHPSVVSAALEKREAGAGPYIPLITPLVGGEYESLRLNVLMLFPHAVQGNMVGITVSSFATDTSIATPPFLYSPTQGSFPAIGVDLGSPDKDMTLRNSLDAVKGENSVVVPLPRLDPGFYQFTIRLISRPDTADSSKLFTMEAVVFGPGFPKPRTIDDLIAPLVYIAGRTQMDSMWEVRSQKEKKRLFDAFWLAEADNERAAGNAIRQYYTRVEEANRYFTTFKEGWRTDRGMLYIVLGAPSSVSHVLDKEIWYYSTNSDDVTNTYVFYRTQGSEDAPLVQNYVLDRHPYFESAWQQAVERWRRASAF